MQELQRIESGQLPGYPGPVPGVVQQGGLLPAQHADPAQLYQPQQQQWLGGPGLPGYPPGPGLPGYPPGPGLPGYPPGPGPLPPSGSPSQPAAGAKTRQHDEVTELSPEEVSSTQNYPSIPFQYIN